MLGEAPVKIRDDLGDCGSMAGEIGMPIPFTSLSVDRMCREPIADDRDALAHPVASNRKLAQSIRHRAEEFQQTIEAGTHSLTAVESIIQARVDHDPAAFLFRMLSEPHSLLSQYVAVVLRLVLVAVAKLPDSVIDGFGGDMERTQATQLAYHPGAPHERDGMGILRHEHGAFVRRCGTFIQSAPERVLLHAGF